MKNLFLGISLVAQVTMLVSITAPTKADEIDPCTLLFELFPQFDTCPLAVLIEEDDSQNWKLWHEVYENNDIARIIDYKDLAFLFKSLPEKEQETLLEELKELNKIGIFWEQDTFAYSQANWPLEPGYIEKISGLLKLRIQRFNAESEAKLEDNKSAWIRHGYSLLFTLNSYYSAFFHTALNAVHELQDNGRLPGRNSPESTKVSFSSLQQAWVHNFHLGFNARNFKHLENKPLFSAIGIGIEMLFNKASYEQWQKSKEAASWSSYWTYRSKFGSLEDYAIEAIEQAINKYSDASPEVQLKLAHRVSEKVVLLGTMISFNEDMIEVYDKSLQHLTGTLVKSDLERFADHWKQLRDNNLSRVKDDAKILFDPLVSELDRITDKITSLEN